MKVDLTPEEIKALINNDRYTPTNSINIGRSYREAIRKLHQALVDDSPLQRKSDVKPE